MVYLFSFYISVVMCLKLCCVSAAKFLNIKFAHISGCGVVGRGVASDTRGPGFESSHQQLLLNIYLLLTVCRKDENKEKEAGNGPFFLKKVCSHQAIDF